MQNVLILGGSYFIGRRITEQCLKEGWAVTLLNRGSLPWTGEPVTQLICDRDDAAAMKQALKGKAFEVVIDVSGLNRKQIEIVCDSLECPVQHWVFISSSAVYDVDRCALPIAETEPLGENPYWGQYGADKIAAEAALISSCTKRGTALTILRPPYMYGEYNYVQRESFIFHHLTQNQPILIPASDNRIQFCYTGDLAKIITGLLERSEPGVHIYNVGDRQGVAFSEWIECCARVCGRSARIIPVHGDQWQAKDYFPFRDYDNVLDVRRIHEIFDTDTPFETGLAKAYQWYCENRNEIQFKPKLTANEKQILSELGVK